MVREQVTTAGIPNDVVVDEVNGHAPKVDVASTHTIGSDWPATDESPDRGSSKLVPHLGHDASLQHPIYVYRLCARLGHAPADRTSRSASTVVDSATGE